MKLKSHRRMAPLSILLALVLLWNTTNCTPGAGEGLQSAAMLNTGGGKADESAKTAADSNGVPLPPSLVTPTIQVATSSSTSSSGITNPISTANARPSTESTTQAAPNFVYPPLNPVQPSVVASTTSTTTASSSEIQNTSTATVTTDTPSASTTTTIETQSSIQVPQVEYIPPVQAQDLIASANPPVVVDTPVAPVVSVPAVAEPTPESSTPTTPSSSSSTSNNTSDSSLSQDTSSTSTSTATSTESTPAVNENPNLIESVVQTVTDAIQTVVDTVVAAVENLVEQAVAAITPDSSPSSSTSTSTSTSASTDFAGLLENSSGSTSTPTPSNTDSATGTSTSTGTSSQTAENTGIGSIIDTILGSGTAVDESSTGATNPLLNNTTDVLPTNEPTTVPDNTPAITIPQPVPTRGPAVISGRFVAKQNDTVVTNICGMPGAVSRCLDYRKVIARLITNADNSEFVVASTYLNADGSFEMTVVDLPNNNYRLHIRNGNEVPIEERHGLNSAHQDFTFIFDSNIPSGINSVSLGNIEAQRLFFTSGPARFRGKILTNGFTGDVTIPFRAPVQGVPVKLFLKEFITPTDFNLILKAEAVSSADGSYEISNGSLPNGRYVALALGSTANTYGRPYDDVGQEFSYTFLGDDASVYTESEMILPYLAWQKSLTGGAAITGNTKNILVNDDSSNQVSVKVKNIHGAVLGTSSVTGSGSFTINLSGLYEGTYTIELTGAGIYTTTSSLFFTPHSAGSTKNINLDTIPFQPLDSQVSFLIKSGPISYVRGSTFNYKPSSNQNPTNLVALFDNALYRDLAKQWMREACGNPLIDLGSKESAVRTCTNKTSYQWNYSTYSTILGSDLVTDQLKFTMPGGKWSYYISAAGYKNSCLNNASPCETNPLSLVVNGTTQRVPDTFELVSTNERSQIAGSVVVTDTLTGASAATSLTNLSNLIVIMLGNNHNGVSYAHITTTSNGRFSFDGNSKVLALPAQYTTNASKIDFVLNSLYFNTSSFLKDSTNLVTNNDSSANIDARDVNGDGVFEYNFKSGSYSVFVVDPLGYITLTDKAIDTNLEARDTYTRASLLTNKTLSYEHSPRGMITGAVTYNLSPVSATITVGKLVNGVFTAGQLRRDCSGAFASSSCTVPTNRASGSDQLITTVNSDAQGNFRLENLNPGNYTLRIEASGYGGIQITRDITVGNLISSVPVSLTPNIGVGKILGTIKTSPTTDFPSNKLYEITLANPLTGAAPPYATLVKMGALYEFTNVSAGSWKLTFTSDGYKTVIGNLDVQAGQTRTYDIITGIETQITENKEIAGKVIDSSKPNNVGIGGLRVVLIPGINSKDSSSKIAETTSSSTASTLGSYSLNNIPPGNYTLEVSGPNVITSYETVISNGANTPASQDIKVSPAIHTQDIRVVLSWGLTPPDLDSHMGYGDINCRDGGLYCMNGWNAMSRRGGNILLDVDDTNGNGPETITLKNSIWTTRFSGSGSTSVLPYYVIDYQSRYSSNSTQGLHKSNAVVTVYSSVGQVKLNVPSIYDGLTLFNVGGNQYWDPFCIDSSGGVVIKGSGACTSSIFINKKSNYP